MADAKATKPGKGECRASPDPGPEKNPVSRPDAPAFSGAREEKHG